MLTGMLCAGFQGVNCLYVTCFFFFQMKFINGKCFQLLLSLHVVAFVYMDANANDDSDLPDELKQKYTIAKLLGRYTLTIFH